MKITGLLCYLILTVPVWVLRYTLPMQKSWPAPIASITFLFFLLTTVKGRSVLIEPLCVQAGENSSLFSSAASGFDYAYFFLSRALLTPFITIRPLAG